MTPRSRGVRPGAACAPALLLLLAALASNAYAKSAAQSIPSGGPGT